MKVLNIFFSFFLITSHVNAASNLRGDSVVETTSINVELEEEYQEFNLNNNNNNHRALQTGLGNGAGGVCGRFANGIGKNVTCTCTRALMSLTFSCTSQRRIFNPTWAGQVDYSGNPIKGNNTLKIPPATVSLKDGNYTTPEFNFASKFERNRASGSKAKLDSCTASYKNSTNTESCTCKSCEDGTKITLDCSMVTMLPPKVRERANATCVTYSPYWRLRRNNGTTFIPGWYGGGWKSS